MNVKSMINASDSCLLDCSLHLVELFRFFTQNVISVILSKS